MGDARRLLLAARERRRRCRPLAVDRQPESRLRGRGTARASGGVATVEVRDVDTWRLQLGRHGRDGDHLTAAVQRAQRALERRELVSATGEAAPEGGGVCKRADCRALAEGLEARACCLEALNCRSDRAHAGENILLPAQRHVLEVLEVESFGRGPPTPPQNA
eukprot:CAMPEP_0185358564 /NCGR_PEP_ID=MMETSP1364-20130426/8262_1 /TAXON_ID=38817 /ORGANISM="Gephyrocapsa oceanica, Strain RCC1303" /LENGTH=162 /DNA_ID=CAMNT_0027958677 /DNA_START=115 /DNA_END=600 /DNA_ORIENTATION=+